MGRTGVFITLSIVLERMRYEGVVDIFQTVKMLRTQRPAMVQTEVRNRFTLLQSGCKHRLKQHITANNVQVRLVIRLSDVLYDFILRFPNERNERMLGFVRPANARSHL